ncbi:MAG: DUF1592 domain-containing protein [Polyangiales bacterium]
MRQRVSRGVIGRWARLVAALAAVGCNGAIDDQPAHLFPRGDQGERDASVDAGETTGPGAERDAGGGGPSEQPDAATPGRPGDAEAPEAPGSEPGREQPGGDEPGERPPTGTQPKPPSKETCAGVVEVGDAPLRRLTRTEYERTVGDVFGVWDNVGSGLAADERIDGPFASNRSSSVAVVQVRQYMDAAEHIASKVNLAIVPCDRAQLGDEACAAQLIEHLGKRAYRRPLSDAEQAAYLGVYQAALAQDGHEGALRLVIQTLLQSPHLLYHLELQDPAAAAPSSVARLPAYALAARLSFFLWSSAPDDVLLAAAESGELDSDDGVAAQAERMFADRRMRGGLESFHAQWLGLYKLDAASRDPMLFPEWSPELLRAIRSETTDFSDYVIRDQVGDFVSLLTASYSFPTGPGLAIRGVTSDTPNEPNKRELGPARAVGLLTQPAFLAAHSHSDQTSPILRGRALRERLLCTPLPDPPPTVAAIAPDLMAGMTTRERYALHRTTGTACMGCHSLIDDFGFTLEHFDPLGRYRAEEQGKPIDSTGMITATDFDGPVDGARALAERLAASAQAQRCYATQWFRYAIGRAEADADRCALWRVQQAFKAGSSIRELLFAITSSDAFMRRKVPE